MKKIISLILAMATAIMAINFAMAEDKTIIEIESINANSGDTISVPIKVTNNTNGVATISLTIDYDSNLLTYENYEKGIYQAETIVNSKTAGQLIVGTMSVSNFTGDGTLFTFNFKVNDNADKNVVSELKLDVSEYYYLDSNYDSIPVDRTVNNGMVYINKSGDDTTTTETSTTTTEITTEIATTETTTITTETSTESTTVIESTTVKAETSTEITSAKEETTITTEKQTETTTTETTTAKAETMTSTDVTTETTTTKIAYCPSSGGGGGGGGVSYRPATTTTTATTESTTESVTVEETTEVTTIAVITKDVKVSVGSNIIYVGDDEFTIDAESYIQTSSNSTMVPLRFVAVAICNSDVENADNSNIISWDAATKTATITYSGNIIKFSAGSYAMTINNVEKTMENGVKAEIKDGRMYIPFRALGNALGVDVDWIAESKTAVYKA